jgi:DnaJ-class molecular chaperone
MSDSNNKVSRMAALRQAIRDIWDHLDYVPDCPMCKGTGEYTGAPYQYSAQVYWKGKQVTVCDQCNGSGKV